MQLIAHKINNSKFLDSVPNTYGVEIDLRMGPNNRLVLSHDPIYENAESFDSYLNQFNKSFLIANIKETGIEEQVIEKLRKKDIDFFLLDVEIPFIVKNYKKFKQCLSIRYSEYEDIETVLNLKHAIDWVWIDTFSKLPELDEELNDFRTCLVSPDRWGREGEIETYINAIDVENVKIEAVMAELKYLNKWESKSEK